MNFLLAINSLDKKAEASKSKEMPRFFQSEGIEREIKALMTSEACSEDVLMANNRAVKAIQDNIVVSELPPALRRILNMWAKTHWYALHCDGIVNHTWFNQPGEAKLELCLRVIVVHESRRRLYERLTEDVARFGICFQMPDEDDVCREVNSVCNSLVHNWPAMATKLTKEALRWIKEHDEHVMDNESEDFMWIHPDTGEECYHLPHLPKPEEHDDEPEEHDVEQALSSLETLPCDFQHDEDWTCPICLEVGEGSTCVRTGCKHVFHASCFDDCKRAYLEHEENVGETCCPCPLCRANIRE